MILKKIQRQLEALYQTQVRENVERFVIKAASSKEAAVGATIKSRLACEALIIKPSPHGIEVGLFVAPSILRTLRHYDPFCSIGNHNLKPFLIATEGVSHFLYFLKRAKEFHPVTRLEMELQAEIDKYLLVSLVYLSQFRQIPSFLFSLLFEGIRFEPSLSEEEKSRYAEANRMARKFCAHLEGNYLRYGRFKNAIQRARRFYHLNHWEKLRFLTP